MEKKNKIDMQQPMMVSSHDVKLDAEYAEWKVNELKNQVKGILNTFITNIKGI